MRLTIPSCKRLFIYGLFLLIFSSLNAQVDLDYYLPDGYSYDPSIPKPMDILDHEVGEWQITHDKLVHYMNSLAQASDRVSIEEYGRTYENRPLLLLTITSPENHANMEQIKADHISLAQMNGPSDPDISGMPSIIWLGHSVHGNEASGANSSLVTAYHFASAQGKDIEDILTNTIILIDPSINPDGLSRFTSWVNSHKSQTPVTDPENLEQNEAWPGGRTNHYWFDLNRDYIPVQHPESRGRIAKIHEWKPNIYTDHHEMGTNSTFFFQPGVPSRVHPLIPKENYSITQKISGYFEEGLNEIQSLYYSQESFDDYYPGRGPTYVDFNGGIAILFEQASSRGHVQESVNGILTFPFAIRNHHRAALATVKAGYEMKDELLRYQKNYYSDVLSLASADPVKAYVFGSSADPARAFHLAEIVRRHNIDVFHAKDDIRAGGNTFSARTSYIVPLSQNEYRTVHALFEIRNSFQDSLFYDVSAWTLPLAFNLDYTALGAKEFSSSMLGEKFDSAESSEGQFHAAGNTYAYAFNVSGYYSYRAIYSLQEAGVKLKVASLPFTTKEGYQFGAGSIIIPMGIQDEGEANVTALVETFANRDMINIYALSTGVTSSGPDLGSNNFRVLNKPKIMTIGGSGISGYEVGELWHLLDQRYHIPLSIVDKSDLGSLNLDRYNTIVLVDGSYGDLSEAFLNKLKSWIRSGGTLIGSKRASRWLSEKEISKAKFVTVPNVLTGNLSYNTYSRYNGAQVIGGSIFKAELDLSHPLGWGFEKPLVPLFKRGVLIMEPSNNPFATPLRYTENALWSGYVPEEKIGLINNSAAVNISTQGQGIVISFPDNHNFRAFWYGTNKLVMNSIFFGQVINRGTGR